MKKYKFIKTVPELIKDINETDNSDDIIRLENTFACSYGESFMIFSAILNAVLRYNLLNEKAEFIMLDTLIFILLGIGFATISRIEIDLKVQTHIVSMLYFIWSIFLTVRFYHFIGPAVWTIAFIQIAISMFRITKIMFSYMAIATFFSGMYVVLVTSRDQYNMGSFYYIVQIALFFILLIISAAVYRVNSLRYIKIDKRYEMVNRQKQEIESMYEEITATEEELRHQNDVLKENNVKIKNNEDNLIKLAFYDSLTLLPNRKMILEYIDNLVEVAKDKTLKFFIVFIDLDNFKRINDTMGHHVGDLFIRSAAERLKGAIGEGATIGRIGGDEFALVFQEDISDEEFLEYVNKLRTDFSKPFQIDNTEIRSSASFGISSYPRDGKNTLDLIKSADTAMYKAKEKGKNSVQFFEKSMMIEIIQRIDMENKLISALQGDEFFMVYQPQYSAKDNKIRGLEALVRWKSKSDGVIKPEKFIKIAEEMGSIVTLGEIILKNACYEYKKLQEKYNLDILLSINISVNQLKDNTFTERVKKILEETGLDPKYLEFEITESIFAESITQTTELLNEIKDLGISISLDDFGTGYSSLNYLRLFPIDVLKIDKSFIADLFVKASKKEIVGDIVSLAHNLDIFVIAEGIEHEEQLEYLIAHNCDCIQGFLLGRPLEINLLEKLFQGDCPQEVE